MYNDYKKQKRNKTLQIIGFIILVIAIFVAVTFAYIYFNKKENFSGIISELSYTRIRYVLEWQKINEENFSEYIPPKAYDIVQNGTRHHHNRSESYSSTCSGTKIVNGKSKSYTYSCTKTRSVPVYHPWYNYKINKFVQAEIFTKSDKTLTGRLQAFDPEIVIKPKCEFEPDYSTNDPYLGCQVEGTPKAFYNVMYLALEPKEVETLKVSCPMAYEPWSDTKTMTKISGQFYVHNRSLICEGIK